MGLQENAENYFRGRVIYDFEGATFAGGLGDKRIECGEKYTY